MQELKEYLMFRDFIFPFMIIGIFALAIVIYILLEFIIESWRKRK